MDKIFYTYVHRRGGTGEVFYVGKGKEKRAWSTHHRNAYWHNVVAKHGYSVEVIAEGLTEVGAHRQEKRLIKLYSRQNLTNMTDGGEGVIGHIHSEETRAKLSAAHSGKVRGPLSEAHKAKLRLRVPSAETRAKISAAHTGRKHSAEHREKNRAARLGVPQSPEWVAARVEGRKGYVHSEEVKRRIGDSNRGRKASAETIEKIRTNTTGVKQSASTIEKRVAHFRKPVACAAGEFAGAADAVKWLVSNGHPKASASCIGDCCKGKRKTAYGLIWRYI